ncbi:MAG: bifunctional aldolase/short-chain dehydrogenase [Proteobacteria bacterium]|nr:bifunctional aldolase/short-chain dehydrogenase [Pseudomonadota bacterium]
MKNLWSNKDAEALVRRYRRRGVSRNLALCVYGSRLLGGNAGLVVHGGGNTSVKMVQPDITGRKVDTLCVKGSGWDLATIEPEGFPAVRLEALRALRNLNELGDDDMLNAVRTALLDATAPTPSVEALLHAFLPPNFVDHTHANALLALTNQADGVQRVMKLFKGKAAIVTYVMSGFALAKAAIETFEANPDCTALIVPQHGVFTFGETAEQAYGRMIEIVGIAEKAIAGGRKKIIPAKNLPARHATLADIAPILRGLIGRAVAANPGRYRRPILDFRTSRKIRTFVDGRDLDRYGQSGTATPDHVIRTKPKPLVLQPADRRDLAAFTVAAEKALSAFQADYLAYLKRNARRHQWPVPEIDHMPRVIFVPGLGLFGLGDTAKDAAIAADIAEVNVETITDAERIGRFQGLDEKNVFDIEFWSLERAKLDTAADLPLIGQVAVVTGGASGIGAATARAFREAGAEVAILDRDLASATRLGDEIGGVAAACDVTDGGSVRRAFDSVCTAFGGVDIVVSNAGAAWQGEIGTVDEAILRQSFELNFFGHQSVAQNAVRVMRAQGTGGVLLFNTSKQAINPGKDFGPYGLPKAATLFLMKQYALDHGKDGIRSNAVNADRIRSGLLTDDMIASRAKARRLSEADYMGGNLLGREVTAGDVAQAFVSLALAEKTTAAVLTVDGGNIEASLR